jgi:cytochrome c oxidase assembly protein subunit 15
MAATSAHGSSVAEVAAGSGGVPLFAPWRHRLALLLLASTLALIFVGGLVTSTESGLAVPDWPLSYGMVMPPMVGGVFYEHGHRLAASFVGFLTLVLALWTWRRETRAGVRRLGWLALLAVVTQGLLGGLTVIYLLPTAISVAHACLAQTFFLLTIAMAYATSREWLGARGAEDDVGGVRPAAVAVTAVIYGQLFLGALMRHLDAGLAIPDFPLAFGRLVPPLSDPRVAVHVAHRLGALAVVVAVGRLLLCARRSNDVRFVRPARALALLVVVQAGLGASVIWTGKAVYPTTAHVATGAAILGLSFFAGLRAHRHLRTHAAAAAVPLPARS